MLLTEEQHQLLSAAGDRPLEVFDPLTQRTYFLLSAEQYQRVRDLVDPRQNDIPATEAAENASDGQPMRVKIRDLAMPPEVAERAKKYCKKMGFWRRKYVQEVEDQFKMQYYFGGKWVAYLPSKEGPVVVAAGGLQSTAFDRQLSYLAPAERREKILIPVESWDNWTSLIPCPVSNHEV